MPSTLFEFGWIDVLDIALVSVLLYAAITWLRRAHASRVLAGIGVLGGLYVAARVLGLQLTAWIFQGFFAIFVIILVVIFEHELRQAFERIAALGFLRRGRTRAPSDEVVEALVRSSLELARGRVGALIAVRGEDLLDRHVEGGVALGGRVSEALLASLFDPHSPAHDGAVIVEGELVTRFAAHLPLSRDFEQLRRRGTRHSAALGLAERTDALCIVVSEERGRISVAHDSRLRELEKPQELEAVLERFVRDKTRRPQRREMVLRALRENGLEKGFALVAAVALWVAFVPGSQTAEVTLSVPVVVENLPPGFEVESVEPPSVEVLLEGSRRQLFFLDPTTLSVRVEALLVGMGRRTFDLSKDDVEHPAGVEVMAVEPQRVKLSVKRLPEAPLPTGQRGEGGAHHLSARAHVQWARTRSRRAMERAPSPARRAPRTA